MTRSTGSPSASHAPPKRRRGLLIAVAVVVVLAVAAVIGIAMSGGVESAVDHATGDPDIAKVGDCLTGSSSDEPTVVACTDPTATERVLAKVDETRAAFEADRELKVCPAPGTESAIFVGRETGSGYVLCLAPVAAH